MSVSDILDRAAERLSKPGAWTQVSIGQCGPEAEPGGSCTANMVCSLAADRDIRRAAIDAICCVIGAEPGSGMVPVWRWNDAPGRQQAEVVAKLRQAANLAREQGK